MNTITWLNIILLILQNREGYHNGKTTIPREHQGQQQDVKVVPKQQSKMAKEVNMVANRQVKVKVLKRTSSVEETMFSPTVTHLR